jgi:DnaJ-class molecular chaperone
MAVADDPQAAGPVACAPCGGTGEVISNLGGEPSRMRCPWCEGTGAQVVGHDAQARWRAGATTE